MAATSELRGEGGAEHDRDIDAAGEVYELPHIVDTYMARTYITHRYIAALLIVFKGCNFPPLTAVRAETGI